MVNRGNVGFEERDGGIKVSGIGKGNRRDRLGQKLTKENPITLWVVEIRTDR